MPGPVRLCGNHSVVGRREDGIQGGACVAKGDRILTPSHRRIPKTLNPAQLLIEISSCLRLRPLPNLSVPREKEALPSYVSPALPGAQIDGQSVLN